MRLYSMRPIAALLGLAAIWSIAWSAQAQDARVETISVRQTHNDSPFDYTMQLLRERPGFRVYRLKYPSPVVTPHESNNTVSAEYYLPADIKPGAARRPAVICLHVLDGNKQISDYACSTLALRGLPSMMFWLPYYGDREIAGGWRVLLKDPNLFLSAVAQTLEDVRRTVDLLASRPEIAPEHIGVMGFSLGGVLAASAAGAEPRLHRAVLFAAGGDVLDIVHKARYTRGLSEAIERMSEKEKADLQARVEAIEPLRLAPALRQRAQEGRVLMFNAVDDGIIPREGTDRLAEALGIADRVHWRSGVEHETFLGALPQMARTAVDFFAEELPPEVKPYAPPKSEQTTPSLLLVEILKQGVAMLSADPEPGRCHRLELNLSLRRGDQEKPVKLPLGISRGPSNRFTLRCTLPAIGEVLLGQGEYPWMVVAGQYVLAGVKHPAEDRNPLQFANQRLFAKFRVVGAAVDMLTMSPDAVEQWANVEAEKSSEGRLAMCVTVKQHLPIRMTLALCDDGATPDRVAFDILGRSGTAKVRDWQYNAAAGEAMFDPPAGLAQKQVEQTELYRLFSVLFDLAMEHLE